MDPTAVLGAQTPAEQRPPSTPSRGAGTHPSAGIASPESERDQAGCPQGSGDRSREAAVGISSTFQPAATADSARRGSAGLCRLPLGDYRDTLSEIRIPPCRNSELGPAVPRGGVEALSGGMCSSRGGEGSPSENVQGYGGTGPRGQAPWGWPGCRRGADVRVRGGMFARAGPAPALFLVPRGPKGGLFIKDRLYQMDLAYFKKKKKKLILGDRWRFFGQGNCEEG